MASPFMTLARAAFVSCFALLTVPACAVETAADSEADLAVDTVEDALTSGGSARRQFGTLITPSRHLAFNRWCARNIHSGGSFPRDWECLSTDGDGVSRDEAQDENDRAIGRGRYVQSACVRLCGGGRVDVHRVHSFTDDDYENIAYTVYCHCLAGHVSAQPATPPPAMPLVRDVQAFLNGKILGRKCQGVFGWPGFSLSCPAGSYDRCRDEDPNQTHACVP